MAHKLPTDITALATTPLFHGLSWRELDAVQHLGTVIDVAPGRRVRCPDQRPAQFAVIVWGEIAATTASGHRRTLGAGDWFGTIAVCWDDYVEPEWYETLIVTTLFVMTRREFLSCAAVCPRLATRIIGLFDETREIVVDKRALAESA
jgi:CRP-like cAMP-binding protein